MTQFDPLPNQVGIQSNSGGDITIGDSSVNIAGHDLSFGGVQSKQELISQLEQLKEAFVEAGETQIISEETAIDGEIDFPFEEGLVRLVNTYLTTTGIHISKVGRITAKAQAALESECQEYE